MCAVQSLRWYGKIQRMTVSLLPRELFHILGWKLCKLTCRDRRGPRLYCTYLEGQRLVTTVVAMACDRWGGSSDSVAMGTCRALLLVHRQSSDGFCRCNSFRLWFV
jgi:hypothetical protein